MNRKDNSHEALRLLAILEYRAGLSFREALLLKLVFTDERTDDSPDSREAWTEETAGQLFDGLDPDRESSDFLLLLAHYGTLHRWKWFPAQIRARAEGVRRYYQVKNATTIPTAVRVAEILEEEGIPAMFIKGMAMKSYYNPDTPRIMSDADILVRPGDYRKAQETIFSLNQTALEFVRAHSTDIEVGMAVIDLHCMPMKNGAGNTEQTWSRSLTFRWRDAQVRVPSPEEMLLFCLYTEFFNLLEGASPGRRLRWLYDAGRILPGTDWQRFVRLVHETGVQYEAAFMIRVLLRFLPWAADYGVNESDLAARKDGNGRDANLPEGPQRILELYVDRLLHPCRARSVFGRQAHYFRHALKQYRYENSLGTRRASNRAAFVLRMCVRKQFRLSMPKDWRKATGEMLIREKTQKRQRKTV